MSVSVSVWVLACERALRLEWGLVWVLACGRALRLRLEWAFRWELESVSVWTRTD